MTEAQPRTLTLIDCIAIGFNGIVGSGVYLLLSRLAGEAGAASVLGIALCSALCILIALCFAELAGMYEQDGGAYLYAREAFGPYVGFAVGWICAATVVMAFATVAVGFTEALDAALGGDAIPVLAKAPIAAGLILVLATINYFGVRAGARTSDVLSFSKMAPLLVLAAAGLFCIRAEAVTAMFSPPSVGAVFSSAFLAIFLLSGFEFTAVPAGVTKDPHRVIPLAILGSLAASAALYCVLQLIAVSNVPDLPARSQPLLDTAEAVLGAPGRWTLGIAALISMAGFCAGSALVGPRYLTSLARDGYIPDRVARINARGTPGAGIALTAGLAAVFALVLDFRRLVDITTIVLFAQYVPSCLAVIVLRRRQPDQPRRFRVPGGDVIPIAATLVTVALFIAARPKLDSWIFSGQILLVGIAVWTANHLWRRRAKA